MPPAGANPDTGRSASASNWIRGPRPVHDVADFDGLPHKYRDEYRDAQNMYGTEVQPMASPIGCGFCFAEIRFFRQFGVFGFQSGIVHCVAKVPLRPAQTRTSRLCRARDGCGCLEVFASIVNVVRVMPVAR